MGSIFQNSDNYASTFALARRWPIRTARRKYGALGQLETTNTKKATIVTVKAMHTF